MLDAILINHDYISNKKQNLGIFVIIEKEWNIESSSKREERTDVLVKAV